MPITNLAIKYSYASDYNNLPVVILLHGWSGDMNSLTDEVVRRMARRQLFVASIGMRGRNSASGTPDASGREIYDIYDALVWIRANFPKASQNEAWVVGYSGGGGNALAAACKFPDAWCGVVSHFGMSDYGRNNPDGWYYNNGGSYTAGIATWVGGTPAVVPNNYYARDASYAINNYQQGHVYLFHDLSDTTVPIIHSQRIGVSLSGLDNYTENYTQSGDANRWIHGYPDSTPLSLTEDVWAAAAANRTHPVWTIPAAGTVRVIGYIVTKRFSIWLGDGTAHVASVVYDTVAGSYTVTPLTGSVSVTITQGVLTATQTISSETTITL